MNESNPQEIKTPIEYSLNIIEGVKNNAFFSQLADFINRLYEKDNLDKSKGELANEFITNFTFIHVRVQNNMDGEIKKRAEEIMWRLMNLKKSDMNNPSILKEIASLGLEYSVLLKQSGLDELTQEIATILLDANDSHKQTK
jgi:hypothetical protein